MRPHELLNTGQSFLNMVNKCRYFICIWEVITIIWYYIFRSNDYNKQYYITCYWDHNSTNCSSLISFVVDTNMFCLSSYPRRKEPWRIFKVSWPISFPAVCFFKNFLRLKLNGCIHQNFWKSSKINNNF